MQAKLINFDTEFFKALREMVRKHGDVGVMIVCFPHVRNTKTRPIATPIGSIEMENMGPYHLEEGDTTQYYSSSPYRGDIGHDGIETVEEAFNDLVGINEEHWRAYIRRME